MLICGPQLLVVWKNVTLRLCMMWFFHSFRARTDIAGVMQQFLPWHSIQRRKKWGSSMSMDSLPILWECTRDKGKRVWLPGVRRRNWPSKECELWQCTTPWNHPAWQHCDNVPILCHGDNFYIREETCTYVAVYAKMCLHWMKLSMYVCMDWGWCHL